MPKMQKSALVSALLGLLLNTQALTAADTNNYQNFYTQDEVNNIEIFKQASPSVVYVTNSGLFRTSRFSLNVQEMPQGSGTGFIWDKSGLIVTNVHVIQDASRITITLQDQSTWDAKVIGTAASKDLALLKIDAPPEALTPIPIGDSSLLEVGRKVIAIGNPFGLDTTLTVGVVSALGREITSLDNRKIRDVIQTDASINPGNSGGPLLNSLGQLIGVNTQILSPSGASAGIGFAIPANIVKKVIPQLLQYGQEVRPVLGLQQIPDSYNRQQGIKGVAILEVFPGSPAAQAGLIGVQQDTRGRWLVGDVITRIGDDLILNSDDLLNALEQHMPGDKVKITTLRNNKSLEFDVVLSAPGEI